MQNNKEKIEIKRNQRKEVTNMELEKMLRN